MYRTRHATLATCATLALLLQVASAGAAVIFSDNFTYADGPLVGAAGSTWANHSGTAGQVNVVSNQVQLTQNESEDVNAALSGNPYSTGTLYAGMDFNFSALPGGTGGYFMHFKEVGASIFRGRVYANITGAALGSYRIGISNGSNPPSLVTIPVDLNLGDTHRLVLAYDTAAVASTLYLDSLTETGGTAAADVVTATPIVSIALRQSVASGNGMGTLVADNLIVGTTFGDVAVAPEPVTLGLTALSLLALRRCRA